jgi:hypothetical protein
MNSSSIVGIWKKISKTECGVQYPDILEFKINGIYYGQTSADTTLHPVWDVGTFQLKEQSISMSTSNDAVIDYEIILEDKDLRFTDPDGCIIKYCRDQNVSVSHQ